MKSRIVRRKNIHLLEVNGELMPLYGYMSYQPEKACYEAFREAGVRLFFVSVYAGDRGINQFSGIRPFRPGFWRGYGEYDFSQADADFRLAAGGYRPGEVYIIPRIIVEPPAWWERENPGELCRDAQGTPIHQSYCSEKWFRDTEEMLEAFSGWLNDSGWAAYIAGWHVGGGNTEEFLRPQHHAMQFSDYSAPALKRFRQWLMERYETIERLNAVWRSGLSGWEEAQFASPAQRMFSLRGALRNPELEQQAMDTYRFINEMNAQAVVRLCEAAKRLTGGQIVIGAFFGYVYMEPDIGHAAADIVYASDAVDFLASPFTYTDNRAPGVDWAFPGCVASSMLHDKPWFMEADVRTCLSRPISQCMPHADPPVSRAYDGPVWTGPDTAEGSLWQMTKAFSRVLTNNTAVWWFDMWGGWYDNEEFMAFHRRAAEVYREHALGGGSPCAAPVAVFMDDSIACEMTPGGGFSGTACIRMRKKLGYIGTPYRQYDMSDFEKIDPAEYRLAVFPTPCSWDESRLKALEKWKADGHVLAFLGSADSGKASGVCHIYPGGLERMPDGEEGALTVMVPVLRYEENERDAVLRRAEDGGAIELVRQEADYSVYVFAGLTPSADVVRKLVCAAAGQVYCFDGDVVYASERYIAVHAASDGIKRICFPYKARLRDVFTGQVLPGNESFVDVNMRLGQTLLLEACRE